MKMATELVNSATSDKLTETDWIKNIEICELVARDNRQAKDVVKAIKKRLGSKNPTAQLFAVTLLEMLLNNIGDSVHKQVVETGILPVLVKIVKKKSDIPVREKIFLLLDAAQTSVGGASGRYPQYYSAYYELVNAGVKFPQRPHVIPKEHPISSNDNKNNPCVGELAASHCGKNAQQPETEKVPDSSILQKASAALEVLREVIDAVDIQHPEGARDEFTLDLVEQCSFQKQRVMHLAMTSRDDGVVSKAIELNEQLDRVLSRHDALVAGSPMSISIPAGHEQSEEEEEAEQLFRRMRKGKARIQPEDEDCGIDRPMGLLGSSVPGNMLHRPLIRPVSIEQKQENDMGKAAVTIPPPPAKHAEREKFFQEIKLDGSTLTRHVRGLSLHSRNASSSGSGSIDFSN
nr:TOM1-like protein 2 isoform X1 [Ipomoea batatas]